MTSLAPSGSWTQHPAFMTVLCLRRKSAMPGTETSCVLILFVIMTIAFAVGSLLVRLVFYSSASGADDTVSTSWMI